MGRLLRGASNYYPSIRESRPKCAYRGFPLTIAGGVLGQCFGFQNQFEAQSKIEVRDTSREHLCIHMIQNTKVR